MESGLASRLTQPDQKLMKSKETEKKKSSGEAQSDLEDSDQNWGMKEVQNEQDGSWWNHFTFPRWKTPVTGH